MPDKPDHALSRCFEALARSFFLLHGDVSEIPGLRAAASSHRCMCFLTMTHTSFDSNSARIPIDVLPFQFHRGQKLCSLLQARGKSGCSLRASVGATTQVPRNLSESLHSARIRARGEQIRQNRSIQGLAGDSLCCLSRRT